MTLAKGLASGVPIGACIGAGPAAGVFKPGNHGSTFGGNPLACAAALATLDIIEEERLMTNAVTLGDHIAARFRATLAGIAGVRDIRNKGLMIGIELDAPCDELVKTALAARLLINVTNDNVIRLLPPLVISSDEAEQLVNLLSPLITDFLTRVPAGVPARKSA
jgi:acetylornithine aminotransferase